MIFGLSTTLFLAMFIAPLTPASGTVPELHGRANARLRHGGRRAELRVNCVTTRTDTMVNPEVPFAWTELPTAIMPSRTPLAT